MANNGIFPPEIYEIILNYVTEPSVLIKCSNICTRWRNLIGHERLTEAHMTLTLPLMLRYLDATDIRNVAAASKRMINVVDNLGICDFGSVENWHRILPPINLEQIRGIRRFLTRFSNHGNIENPLIFRRVLISETASDGLNLEYYQEFSALVSEFLDKYGDMIHSLDLTTFSGNLLNLVKYIHMCLSKCPNLNYLLLQVQSTTAGCVGEHGQELQTFLNLNPIPTSKLAYLMLDLKCRIPSFVVQLLYRNYGNQLKLVSNLRVISIPALQLEGLTFENLKDIRVSFNGDRGMEALNSFAELLATLSCKLDFITITFRGNFSPQYQSFAAVKKIFIALTNHQSEIWSVKLKLEDWHTYLFPVELLSHLKMENLTYFLLYNIRIPNINFFKFMPKLTNLTMLQATSFDTFVTKSNITDLWKVMKKLRSVNIEQYREANEREERVAYRSRLDEHCYNLKNGGF